MEFIRKLLGLDDTRKEEVSLHVQPISDGGYGVCANKVVIAIHHYKADADAHCQRLKDQQAQDAQADR